MPTEQRAEIIVASGSSEHWRVAAAVAVAVSVSPSLASPARDTLTPTATAAGNGWKESATTVKQSSSMATHTQLRSEDRDGRRTRGRVWRVVRSYRWATS